MSGPWKQAFIYFLFPEFNKWKKVSLTVYYVHGLSLPNWDFSIKNIAKIHWEVLYTS